jgi:hypothetical protein
MMHDVIVENRFNDGAHIVSERTVDARLFAWLKRRRSNYRTTAFAGVFGGVVAGVFIGALLCLLCPSALPAQVDQRTEYKFKAAYLYNFLQFIEWPDQAFPVADSPLIVGVIGDDPFEGALQQTMQDENVNGRKVSVQRISKIEDATHCHCIFIPRSKRDQLVQLLSILDSKHVLTVSEIEGFADLGGGINFYVQDNKLRFEVNTDVLQKAKLKVSSKLLRLARVVKPKSSGE